MSQSPTLPSTVPSFPQLPPIGQPVSHARDAEHTSTPDDSSIRGLHSLAYGAFDPQNVQNILSLAAAAQSQSQPQSQTSSPEPSASANKKRKTAGGDTSAGEGSTGDDAAGSPVEVGKTGRPLSNTKRAQQNRAAQRAFRERRDKHIKELEEKAKLLETALASAQDLQRKLEDAQTEIHALRAENLALRHAPASDSSGNPNPSPPATAAASSGNGIAGIPANVNPEAFIEALRRYQQENSPAAPGGDKPPEASGGAEQQQGTAAAEGS